MKIRHYTHYQNFPYYPIEYHMYNASHNMAGIFNLPSHNGNITPLEKSPHYSDQLERFTRDFAATEKHRRELQRNKKNDIYSEKRRHRQIEEQQKMRREAETVLMEHQHYENKKAFILNGVKKNAHMTSLPMNPITSQYQNSPLGYQLYQHELQKKTKDLMRTKMLQQRSNASHNPINGQYKSYLNMMVPQGYQDQFQRKTYQYKKKYLQY